MSAAEVVQALERPSVMSLITCEQRERVQARLWEAVPRDSARLQDPASVASRLMPEQGSIGAPRASGLGRDTGHASDAPVTLVANADPGERRTRLRGPRHDGREQKRTTEKSAFITPDHPRG